jgi:hypothetical protein
MSIFARFKAKNWFEGPVCIAMRSIAGRRIKPALKNKKITILTFLILISGFFFYNRLLTIFPKCFANDFKTEGYLEHENEWTQKISYIESVVKKQNEQQRKNISIRVKNDDKKEIKLEKFEKTNVSEQIYQIVGNAPIREMVPSIMKLDQRVAAFVIGIAKKESDWGRHAPTQGGRTCFNYWGYKGTGSRGTSMGYACFGSTEEAVEIVGKRIGTLVDKNINEPRKMLVWKCGASCAGHDPGGVAKWVSDVSLYFGKVMQIKNS